MRRSLVVVILGLCVSLASHADPGKQKIAVLGLETVGPSAAETARVARDFSRAVRTAARAGGPYALAPGTDKQLRDVKASTKCRDEAPACMAKIGANLGSDYLMYGKLERKSLGGQAGYQVTLKLFGVTKRKMLLGWTDFIPTREATGSSLQDWARKGYRRLTAP